MWVKVASDRAGHHLAHCPNCEKIVEKYDTLDELDGFGRAVRLHARQGHAYTRRGDFTIDRDLSPVGAPNAPVWTDTFPGTSKTIRE